jgi:putative transposase
MASSSSIDARKTLRKLFSARRLRSIAMDTGAVVRQRKVDPVALFWTVVLGFGVGRTRSIAGLRRSYERATGQCLEESSFYQRFNEGFTAMLERALVHALAHDAGIGRRLRGHLSRFVDVLITDATVLKVHELLQAHWPGSRTNHSPAALKAHWVLSVAGNSRQSVKLTAERRHDGPVFQVGPWVKGRLLLFDLGYYGFSLFERIGRNGGYFISRLKSGANPKIVAVNRVHRGRSVALEGERLQEVLARLKREVLDVDVEVIVAHRRYGGRRRTVRKVFRLVGVRDPDTARHHLYITNARPEELAAEHIQRSYALRWEVELLFRELKSHYRLEELPSRKPEVVKALIYAAALTLLVSRRLLHALRGTLRKGAQRLKSQRWAAIVAGIAADLLLLVLCPPRETRALHRRLNKLLLHEGPDPNVNRMSLLESVETGTHRYRRAAPACG